MFSSFFFSISAPRGRREDEELEQYLLNAAYLPGCLAIPMRYRGLFTRVTFCVFFFSFRMMSVPLRI